jgi:hypothetical protein
VTPLQKNPTGVCRNAWRSQRGPLLKMAVKVTSHPGWQSTLGDRHKIDPQLQGVTSEHAPVLLGRHIDISSRYH